MEPSSQHPTPASAAGPCPRCQALLHPLAQLPPGACRQALAPSPVGHRALAVTGLFLLPMPTTVVQPCKRRGPQHTILTQGRQQPPVSFCFLVLPVCKFARMCQWQVIYINTLLSTMGSSALAPPGS